MFYLRTTKTKDGEMLYNMNLVVGEAYERVDRFTQYNRFCDVFKAQFGRDHVADCDDTSDNDTKSVHGFIIGDKCGVISCRTDERHFIMTESGSTFDSI